MASWQTATGHGGLVQESLSEVSYSVAANTSSVSHSADMYVPAGTWWNSADTSWSVGGDVVSASGMWAAPGSAGSAARWVNVHSGTYTITHNTDGTKSVSESASSGDSSTYGFGGPATAGGTLALTTIPRATQPTLSDDTVEAGTSTTINLPRASTAFTHDITYSVGALSAQTSGLSASTGVATSATFTPPIALLKQMIGLALTTLLITVVTKNGATVIGTKTVTMSLLATPGGNYQNPARTLTLERALSNGTVDAAGTCLKVTLVASVSSILVSSAEQNTLTYKIEAKPSANSTYPTTPLVNSTVASHGLSLSTALTYTDWDPVTAGTQAFDINTSYDVQVTITDALGNAIVTVAQLAPGNAILELYKPNRAISVGSRYDAAIGGSAQYKDETYQRGGNVILDVAMGESNICINGDGRVNQRGATSGTSLASGAYFLDRWKSLSASNAVTWTGDEYVGRTLTIPSSKAIATIIERLDLPAGVYTVSWTGTAGVKVYNSGGTVPGSYTTGGKATFTADGTTDVVFEFGPGTLYGVSIRPGSTVVPFNARAFSEEMLRSQRYYWRWTATATNARVASGISANGTMADLLLILPVSLRDTPTIGFSSLTVTDAVNYNLAVSAVALYFARQYPTSIIGLSATHAGTATSTRAAFLSAGSTTSYLELSAEL